MDQKRINIIIVHGELQEVLQFLMLVEWLEEPRIGDIMEPNTKLHLMLSKVKTKSFFLNFYLKNIFSFDI